MNRMRLVTPASGLAVFLFGVALSACGPTKKQREDAAASAAVSVSAWGLESAKPSEPAPGPHSDVVYEVRDAKTGALVPAKLTFVGVHGTKNPTFTTTDIPREEGHAIAAYARVMSLTGDGRIAVPLGHYDVYVSRGPEWSLVVLRDFTIGAEGAVVSAKLTHEVPTPGWISGDFHVHAASSFDSRVPMRARIFEFVSDGVDLIVSSDHNFVADYQPIIRELDAQRLITSMPGDEITTRDWGHFGAFPLPIDPEEKDGGAPRVKNRTPKQIFGDVRKRAPGSIIDVHHPRFDRGMGYFSTGIFDPKSARSGRPGFSFDFDAIEVLNGYEDADRAHVDQVMRDWFSLLSHGYLVTAMGNSDTHHLNYNLGGYPRDYVKVAHDEPAEADNAEIALGVKKHAVMFTTGPIVELTVGAAGLGETVHVDKGTAVAHVVVRAAGWVPTDKLTLYANGKVVASRAITSKDTVRLDEQIAFTVDRDTFVVARVDASEPLPPVVGDLDKHFEAYPLAITNPVFLDVDGDGTFDPPKKP